MAVTSAKAASEATYAPSKNPVDEDIDGMVRVRLDAFVLPFADLYVIGGFNTGKIEFDITIDPVPIILPEGAKFRNEEDYIGGWIGGGTIALG